jgi:tripartite-type tricarboxylate transporter receptor subunit TctC
MEILKAAAGLHRVHIPRTGAGPAVLAPLGGQVDALATGPSLKEPGYGAGFARWSAPFVPAGTPDAVVRKLRAAATKAASTTGQPWS